MSRKDKPAGQLKLPTHNPSTHSSKLAKRHQAKFQWRFLSPHYWPTWSIYLLCFFLRLIPIKVLAWMGNGIAALMIRGNGRRKRLAMTNFELCFPELSPSEKRELYQHHARILAHVYMNYGRLFFDSRNSLLDRFDVEGMAHIDQVKRNGKNLILLVPHSLAFEYIGQFACTQLAIVSVARTHANNKLLDWMVTRFRTRFGGEFLSTTDSMLPLIRSVRRGNVLFYLPDEDQGQATSVFAPFYGVEKATMPTLGRLVKACNASVVPVVPLYDPDSTRFTLRFLPALEAFPTGDPVEDATRINQVIEDIIDVDRAQYMWSAKIFRTRPDGEKKLYR